MGSLWRPTVVEWYLDGKRVRAKTPGAAPITKKSPTWWGKWIVGKDPVTGKSIWDRRPLHEKKSTAQTMLAAIETQVAMGSVGLADPYAVHRAVPLTDHLADYLRKLAASGDGAKHLRSVEQQITAALTGIAAEQVADLQPSAVLEYLAGLREPRPLPALPPGDWLEGWQLQICLDVHAHTIWKLVRQHAGEGETRGVGKARRFARPLVTRLQEIAARGASIATTNAYLTSLKGFTRWLAREDRCPRDPLQGLSRQNADVDVRRVRRALESAEFSRLLIAAREGRPFRGLGGLARYHLYLLAARSGFRAGELASLTPESFHWQDGTVTVQAGYSKRRRQDVQPLPAAVVAELHPWVIQQEPGRPLWPGGWQDDGAEMVRADLQTAGIPYEVQGCVYDFHSLRHQFITDLVNDPHTAPKDAQTLARHSTITLTMDRYGHARQASLRASLDRLPQHRPEP